jgi:uncharacterized protein
MNNKDLFIEISMAFSRGDISYLKDQLAENVQWNILGFEPIKGKANVLETLKMTELESFPEITVKNIISDGKYVVIESNGKARTKQGKPYNQTYCDVFKFENEKLQEINTYLDTALSKEVTK